MEQLVKTDDGLAIASVKTVAGLAIASVKTIDGLDNTSSGGGGIALVATVKARNVSGGTTGAIDTTGANLIVVAISGFNAPTLVDSKTNTWTGLTLQTGGNSSTSRLFYCVAPTVGSGHTFTSAAGLYQTIVAFAFSGANASPYVGENGANTGSNIGNNFQPGAVNPGVAGSVVVTAGGAYNNATAPTIDSSFVYTADAQDGNGTGCAQGYLLSVSGSTNPTFTSIGFSGSTVVAVIATFKP